MGLLTGVAWGGHERGSTIGLVGGFLRWVMARLL